MTSMCVSPSRGRFTPASPKWGRVSKLWWWKLVQPSPYMVNFVVSSSKSSRRSRDLRAGESAALMRFVVNARYCESIRFNYGFWSK